MSNELNDKIADLEIRLTFQDDLLAAMNRRVAEQDNEIAKLQMQLQHLSQKLKDSQAEAALGSATPDEKPPHY